MLDFLQPRLFKLYRKVLAQRSNKSKSQVDQISDVNIITRLNTPDFSLTVIRTATPMERHDLIRHIAVLPTCIPSLFINNTNISILHLSCGFNLN